MTASIILAVRRRTVFGHHRLKRCAVGVNGPDLDQLLAFGVQLVVVGKFGQPRAVLSCAGVGGDFGRRPEDELQRGEALLSVDDCVGGDGAGRVELLLQHDRPQGRAGDNITLDAKVLASRSYTRQNRGGQTAASTVYLSDAAGNLYTWRASTLNAFRDGTYVRLTGRVKGHDITDGHRHTVLTRCILTPIDVPADWARSPTSTEKQDAITAPSAPAQPAPVALPANDDASPSEPEAVPEGRVNPGAEPTDDPAEVGAIVAPDLASDVAGREARIRLREITLKIEEHAGGYHRSTGVAHRYIAEMVNATPSEWEWIERYIAEHPEVLELPYRTPTQWDEIRRTRAETALREAEVAQAEGDIVRGLDCLDETRACGLLSPAEWHRARERFSMHDHPESAPHAAPGGPDRNQDGRKPPGPDPLADRRAEVRRRQLLLAIEQHGPGYHRITGDGVRYAAEAVNATREEWDWMADQVRASPQLLEGEPLGDGRIHDINKKAARRAFAAATEAIKKGDYVGALDRLDDAEVHWPTGHPDRGDTWDRYRAVVLERTGTAPTAALLPPERPGAGPPPNSASGTRPGVATDDATRDTVALARVSHPTAIATETPADRPPADLAARPNARTLIGRSR